MTQPPGGGDGAGTRRRFARTLASVMAVQIVTLALLWFLQQHFSR